LRLLGYRVERNVTINGCQIDVFAEYRTGMIPLRLMVECKDYGDGRTVGIEEVNKFSGILHVARGKAVDKGLLVTTHGFTREAKEFAREAGIELVTFSNLSTELVNFDDYIEKVIAEFEDAPAFSYYVDLTGTETEDYEGAPASDFHRPLDNLVNRFLFEAEGTRLALLGNFGTGKTTFCRKFAHDLARKYKQNQMSRIPIVVGLSDYESKLDIQELVTNTLQFRYGVRIDLTLCQELQRLGRFLLLFDGFDEMASRVDADIIDDNLREVNKISQIPENKFILTCRTHFFRDRVQADVLGDFDIIYIPEWGESELKEYLQRYFGNEWERQLDRINGTHNLTELAETPLFLEMIVETLPKLGEQVRRNELYKVYTDKWIQEESRRRGARLNSVDRKQLVNELAVKLYSEGKVSCHHSEFASIARDRFQLSDAAQIDYLQSDIRTCTFLTRDANGNYGFRHKSFMEFFVAQLIAEQIRAGSQEYLRSKITPLEITRFVVEALTDDPPAEILTTWLRSEQNDTVRENVLSLLTRLRIDFLDPQALAEPVAGQETRLAARFVQGDVDAFNKLYVENRGWLIDSTVSWTRDRSLAEDVVAETFLRAWRKRDNLQSVKHLRAFLHKIARNIYFDQLRRPGGITFVEPLPDTYEEIGRLVIVDTAPNPEVSYEQTEKYRIGHGILEAAIGNLTGIERLVIEGTYLNEKSSMEIAKELGRDVQEIRYLIHRGTAKLKYRLKQEGIALDKAGGE
jgi:RNA polymerase sigma factor (sigma-70 family)